MYLDPLTGKMPVKIGGSLSTTQGNTVNEYVASIVSARSSNASILELITAPSSVVSLSKAMTPPESVVNCKNVSVI